MQGLAKTARGTSKEKADLKFGTTRDRAGANVGKMATAVAAEPAKLDPSMTTIKK